MDRGQGLREGWGSLSPQLVDRIMGTVWPAQRQEMEFQAYRVSLSFLWRVRGSSGPATDGRGADEVESCFSLGGLEQGPCDDLRGMQRTPECQSSSGNRSGPRGGAPWGFAVSMCEQMHNLVPRSDPVGH